MAFENKDLSQLMEEVRKQRESSAAEVEDDWDEDYDMSYDYEEEYEPIDLDACVDSTLTKLELYHLSEEERQTVREFLTFRIQTVQAPYNQPEARRGYYNLLLHGDEKESIRHFADVLRTALDIGQSFALIRTERELLPQLEAARRPPLLSLLFSLTSLDLNPIV